MPVDGHLNIDLADCMPLAVTNKFHVTVYVYRSRIPQQVTEVQLDLVQSVGKVAYVACVGSEQYNGIRRKVRLMIKANQR